MGTLFVIVVIAFVVAVLAVEHRPRDALGAGVPERGLVLLPVGPLEHLIVEEVRAQLDDLLLELAFLLLRGARERALLVTEQL